VAANHQNSRLLDSTIRLTNTFVGGHSFKVGWKRQTEFLITPAVRVDWLKRQTANWEPCRGLTGGFWIPFSHLGPRASYWPQVPVST